MAATAASNSANPLRMNETRQSADRGSGSERRHRLGSSARNGPRRKPNMAEAPFEKNTIEDLVLRLQLGGAADTPTPFCILWRLGQSRGVASEPRRRIPRNHAGRARMWRKCE